jgi:hypothetical protein
MRTPVISVDGLTKRYGSAVAVDRVSFQVDRGEIFGLLGGRTIRSARLPGPPGRGRDRRGRAETCHQGRPG